MGQRLLGLLSVAVCLWATACSSSGPGGAQVCQSDAECPSGQVCHSGVCGAPSAPSDGGSLRDGGLVDGGLVDGGLEDGGLLDGGASDGGDAGPAGAGFGQHCSQHGDCESQVCLETARGGICTTTCRGDCPPDYVCKSYVLDRDRIVNLCTPYNDVYCVRCAQSSDCAQSADRCTDLQGANYCTKDCSASNACPVGYECRDVAFSQTAEGHPDAGISIDAGMSAAYRQCLPTTGKCPGCIDRDRDGYGVGADCLGPDCDDTDPNIHPGATEICDGKDNNCDGRIDEGFDKQSDDANCGTCGITCNTTAGQRCCGGQCVDTRASPTHCGGCGHPCTGEAAACCNSLCQDTQTDPANCGGCGQPCTNDNGGLGCAAGRCTPVCTTGFGDCDANPRNGCETRLNTAENCGGCGTVCRNTNGSTSCVAGACSPVCRTGYDSCDNDANNGCETNLNTSTSNCGRCSQVCTNAHGTTACDNGLCRPVCDGVFADCDTDPRNGCETDTTLTTAHCGACNQGCTNERGTTRCEASLCRPTCTGTGADCDGNPRNGCETDTSASLAHCGGCNAPCVNPRGTTSCVQGACIPSCGGTGADCDGNPRNGCETDTATNVSNCGGCTLACANAHGTTACIASTCAPTCAPGYGDCDSNSRNGCETDTRGSVTHCGGCNQACVNPHGTTSCQASTCVPTCAPGFFDCNGNTRDGCEADLSVVTVCNVCAADPDCPTNFFCQTGVCTKKKPQGDDCTLGTTPNAPGRECQSGKCVDGVCCNSDCTGTCRACDQPGARGTCVFIPSGFDPKNQCEAEPTAACGQDGTCDGAGGCRLFQAGTTCSAQSCTTGVQANRRTCDGFHNCSEALPPSTLCAPYVCNGGTACFASCSTSVQCASGYSCVSGVCKVAGGQACNGPGDCASGNCVDGVCCNEACGGLCEKCNLPGLIGSCTAVPGGTDPDNECDEQAASTCGRTGVCSGSRGSCALHSVGTVCVAQSCPAGVQNNTRLCDGNGTCTTPSPAASDCFPYVCNATTQSCFNACTKDANCSAGYACANGLCKKQGGGTCTADGQCASGFCADGVCCESRCGGVCEKCNQASRAGFCDAIPQGQNPDGECATQTASTCGTTGVCSGQRSCALHPTGTTCVAGFCNGNTSNPADLCDGQGHCVDSGTRACAPFTCDATSGVCRATCATAADCIAGYECAAGVCKKSKGQACGADAECSSSFCTDSVCCEARCNGVCEKCSQTGRAGFCDPIPGGTDPDLECPTDATSTCQRNGLCSGLRSCSLYASGTVCQPSSCSGQVSSLADTCNGTGSCIDNGTRVCFPYTCDAPSGLCKAACTASTDCQSGYECAGGVCKKSKGQSCGADAECSSAFCTDNVCCEARCSGVCEKCNQAGRVGFCDAVPTGTDPDDECPTEAPSTCGKTGFCSGSRTCSKHPTGTVCIAAFCSGNVSNAADTCDGTGTCVDNGTRSCAPYTCDAGTGLCRALCTVSGDCQAGYDCAGGVCKKAKGQTCAADGDCATAFCTDTVCCEARCGGVCEKCNQSGRAGFCDAIAVGTDPDDECPAETSATCGKTGMCSGNRSCTLHPSGTVCVSASCASNVSSLADTCNGQGQCTDNGTQNCAPYVCNTATGLCRGACSVTADCQAGYDCFSGLCKKSAGQACAVGAECGSLFCTDGVCCATACGGICEKCNLAGTVGACAAIAAGQDPDSECATEAASTCGKTGVCSGSRSCALYPAPTVCVAASCAAGNTSNLARTCNGSGTCQAVSNVACGNLLCDTTTGLCKTTCTANADCVTGYDCVTGTCKKSRGQTCGGDGECASAFCTDSVCCEARCGGLCEKCNLAGRVGFCDAMPAGRDDDNECAADPVPSGQLSACGQTGQCNGARACQIYSAGTVCVAAACSGATSNLARTCNGTGTCTTGTSQNCSPNTCDATTGLCLLSCTGTGQGTCVPGYDCVAGTCKKSRGQACASGTECYAGFCTDGVCCESGCGGSCEKCNQAATAGPPVLRGAGFCDAIPANTDPDNECPTDSVSGCGKTGLCSGSRSCQLYSSGTVCAVASCSGNVSSLADTCTGSGACTDNGTQTCFPYLCTSASGLCKTTCTTSVDCVSGYECLTGICKKSQTLPCAGDGECASGFCTDGFCCDQRCGGVCESCKLATRAGFCDAVAAGQNPDSECLPAATAASCGKTGLCSGSRSCQLYALGAVCNAASCIGPANISSNGADTCNGTGACIDSGVQLCLPYNCNTTSGVCRTSCSVSTDCQSGYQCAAGVCKKSNGQTCAADGECALGFCTDGFCCDGRCGGTCESCKLAGTVGACTAIPTGTDPENDCPTDPVAGCQRTGLCNGARACQIYASGAVCLAASCTGNVSNYADTCNGTGTCVDQGTQSCAPYICNAGTGLCKSTCALNSDCQSGYQCSSGLCKKSQGQACGVAAECASNNCADGFCCDTACAGTCESCKLAGTQGACTAIPSGLNPDGECPAQTQATCGRTGVCSGARSCKLFDAGAQCLAASCVAGNASSTNANTCDGSGVCTSRGTTACGLYLCNPATGSCRTACTANTDCITGYECAGGTCKKSNGQTCGVGTDCATGNCTDGFCCNLPCNGPCESCKLAGSAGTCNAVPNGTDPDNECADAGAATCGTTGLCNGARSCALYPLGTQCVAATCAGASSSNPADTCNGAGSCINSGVVDCTPYACNSTGGLCRTSCTVAADCASGYGCAAGVCKLVDGSTCATDSQCQNNACCGTVCVNKLTNASNCGLCGRACTNANGSTSCVAGTCTPVCNLGFASCDSNVINGCETSIRTTSNCNACGTTCSRANATATCASGACLISSCNSGFSSCDSVDSNGCEVSHATEANVCAAPLDLGAYCADENYGCGFLNLSCCNSARFTFATQYGRQSKWFRARANECSSAACSGNLHHYVTLTPPTGTDYDLYIYSSCGALIGSSLQGGSATEIVDVSRVDTAGSTDSFDYWVEVRWFSGNSCSNWTLTIEGNTVP